jgi:hypothetical protein
MRRSAIIVLFLLFGCTEEKKPFKHRKTKLPETTIAAEQQIAFGPVYFGIDSAEHQSLNMPAIQTIGGYRFNYRRYFDDSGHLYMVQLVSLVSHSIPRQIDSLIAYVSNLYGEPTIETRETNLDAAIPGAIEPVGFWIIGDKHIAAGYHRDYDTHEPYAMLRIQHAPTMDRLRSR